MSAQQLGPYLLGKRIGKGGMGSVYEAVDQNTGQQVAVKSLNPQLASAEGFRERFEAEIESLKILQHDNIVRLLGYGEHEGVLFYSMELVDGPSLEEEIDRERRFNWKETLNIGIQICRALKHAHDHGVVHRDIKPANLLLTSDGRVKIADFGIARLFGSTQLTTAGGVLGTADYMSPEQADGRAVTDRCDQYSLGSVMYALLAGRPPFRAKTMPEMLQLQRFAEAEPVRRYAPQTPEQLDQLIGQLLNKDPEQRFPNTLVLARHMEAMHKALSRREELARSDDEQATSTGNASGVENTAASQPDQTIASAASGQGADSIDLIIPDEVYDAPTMAAEDEVSASVSSAPTSIEKGDQPRVEPPRTTRFTTVDDQARQRPQPSDSDRWELLLQLGGLLGALAAVIGIGWYLMRPASADQLYDEIVAAAERDDLRSVASALAEFNERFAGDARNAELDDYRDELEMQKLERRTRARSRLAGGVAMHPAEVIFRDAMAIVPYQPAEAAARLRSLQTLYSSGESSSAGPWLALAERQLEKLEETEVENRNALLPDIMQRLEEAAALEQSDPRRARAMYRAAIMLFQRYPWAAEVVDAAQQRLDAME